jgi:hypothetical protein
MKIREKYPQEIVEAFFGDEADDITSQDLLDAFIRIDLYGGPFFESQAWKRFLIAIKRAYPHCRDSWITSQSLREILRANSEFDSLLYLLGYIKGCPPEAEDPWRNELAWVRLAQGCIDNSDRLRDPDSYGMSERELNELLDLMQPICRNRGKSFIADKIAEQYISELYEIYNSCLREEAERKRKESGEEPDDRDFTKSSGVWSPAMSHCSICQGRCYVNGFCLDCDAAIGPDGEPL